MKLFLSAGHYKKSQGASYNDTTEWQVTTKLLNDLPLNDYIVIVPEGTIGSKVKFLEKNMTDWDIAIDLHLNAPGENNKGAMILYNEFDSMAVATANRILEAYCDETGQKFNSVSPESNSQYQELGFISNGTKFHDRRFVLELGFISNPEDLKFVQKQGVVGILGILGTFNPNLDLNASKSILGKKISRLRRLVKKYPRLQRFIDALIKKLKNLQHD